MPGPTVKTTLSNSRNMGNSPTGGQWQPSTSGVPVPALPHGTVPSPGYTGLGTHQVAQRPALVSNSPSVAPGMSSGQPDAPTVTQTARTAGTNIGGLVSKGAAGIGSLGARARGFLKGF